MIRVELPLRLGAIDTAARSHVDTIVRLAARTLPVRVNDTLVGLADCRRRGAQLVANVTLLRPDLEAGATFVVDLRADVVRERDGVWYLDCAVVTGLRLTAVRSS